MSDTLDLQNREDSSQGDYDLIPRGRYPLKCIEAVQTISGAGNKMVTATLEITGDNYANRKLWDHFVWLKSSSWKIAQVLDAGGSPHANDPNLELEVFVRELQEGLSFSALVTIEKDKDGKYKDKNAIGKFKPLTKEEAGQSTKPLFA